MLTPPLCNECVNKQAIHTKKLLQKIQDQLEPRINKSKNKSKIDSFFLKMKELINVIAKTVPEDCQPIINDFPTDRLDKKILYNINGLISLIPLSKQSKSIQRTPPFFEKSIKQLITYCHGDTDWLTCPKDTENDDNSTKISLVLEKNSADLNQPKILDQPRQGINNQTKETEEGNANNFSHLIEYDNISSKNELSHILETFFQLLYPTKTIMLSMKHCRKTVGKPLASFADKKIGAGQEGNKILYKIITDEALNKFFRDDRIIAALEQSIYIPLLKIVIHTAIYRLRKSPEKFSTIGDISFFVDLEQEMLGSSLIKTTLLDLVVNVRGARALFKSSSSRARSGLELIFENDPSAYTYITRKLLNSQDKAKKITSLWTLKFSSNMVKNSKINNKTLNLLFTSERAGDLECTLRAAAP